MSAKAAPAAHAPAAPTEEAAAPPKAKKGLFVKVAVLAFIGAVIGGECLFAYTLVNSAATRAADTQTAAAKPSHEVPDAPAEEGESDEEHGEESAEEGEHGEGADNEKEGHGSEEAAGGESKEGESSHGEDEGEKGHDTEKGESDEGEHGKSGHEGEAGEGASDKENEGGGEPMGPVAGKGDDVEVDLGQYQLTAFQTASNSAYMISFHVCGAVPQKMKKEFTRRFEASQQRIREQVIVTVRGAEFSDLTDPGLGLIKRRILEKTNRTLGKAMLRGIVVSDFMAIEQ